MKFFSIGLLLGCFLAGCVSATFTYKYFYPEFVSYEGKLIGTKPSEDLDGKVCAKDSSGNHGCVVMLKPEFEALALDYLDTQNNLVKCQRQCQ